MKVLVACEYSGVVRDAFIKRGHDAMSCDLLPTESPGPHYQGDINDVLWDYWDLVIAHPPCTFLANSGVRHLVHKRTEEHITFNLERYKNMIEGIQFFNAFKRKGYRGTKVCIENPIPHGWARYFMGGYTQLVQPWMFGHLESKATCFWLMGLDPLKETNNVKEEMDKLPKNEKHKVHYTSPGKDRWKLRSRTYQGIADAMAEQWGSHG